MLCEYLNIILCCHREIRQIPIFEAKKKVAYLELCIIAWFFQVEVWVLVKIASQELIWRVQFDGSAQN